MTISYAGNFARLLLRWKGSIWKSVWKELTFFLALYYLIRLVYNFLLSPEQQQTFEYLALMFENYTKNIPLTFLLGFYINAIVKRWWAQFEWVAWPDDVLSLVCVLLPADDPDSRWRRHSIARYLNLTAALAWRDISIKTRKRFPTVDHFVTFGLMTEEELKLFNAVQTETIRWHLPLQWVQKIVQRACIEGNIPPPILSQFLRELKLYRVSFRKLYCYDWVCIPLVYTQVAALATYGYFGFCLLGRQFLNPAKKYVNYEVDFFVPIFTIVQFLFFVGWFKVGQDLMRPFGTDDDDIELNYILDRNIQASFALVNTATSQEPSMKEDKFWNKFNNSSVSTIPLPHTKLSSKLQEHPPKLHSFVRVKRPTDADFIHLPAPIVNEQGDSTTMTQRPKKREAAKSAMKW